MLRNICTQKNRERYKLHPKIDAQECDTAKKKNNNEKVDAQEHNTV